MIKGGDGVALYTDCYTGKVLRGSDRYDYEHIRSSEEVFITYRNRSTNHEIAKVVNCLENVSVTLRTINQSKGKMRMEDWMSNSSNISTHGIDVSLTRRTLANADRGVEIKLRRCFHNRQVFIREGN